MNWLERRWLEIPIWVWILFGSLLLVLIVAIYLAVKFKLGWEVLENFNVLGVLAFLSSPFFLWRLMLTTRNTKISQKNADISLQSSHTTSYFKALEVLEKNDVISREGAINELGKIAYESQKHHRQIIKLLCSYLKKHTPYDYDNEKEKFPKQPKEDIQAVVTVFANQNPKWLDLLPEDYHLAMSNLNLHGCDFQQDDSKNNKSFVKANFMSSCLVGTNFIRANLERAMLNGAHLDFANLHLTNFRGASLHRADLRGASLYWADLREAGLLQEQLDGACGDANTQISKNLKRPEHWNKPSLEQAINASQNYTKRIQNQKYKIEKAD